MRHFEVWLDRNVPGCEPSIVIVELPDDATQEEIDSHCGDTLDVMISNELDTGWREIEAKKRLGIKPAAHRQGEPGIARGIDWDAQPLGQQSDYSLAKQLGCHITTVHMQRTKRGIPPFVKGRRPKK